MSAAVQQQYDDLILRHFVTDAPAGNTVPAQSAAKAINEMVENFDLLEDWTERYQYIIDQGKKMPALPPQWQTSDHLLHGCQSQVWLVTYLQADRLHIAAHSDSTIVSGLIALLKQIYDARMPQEILATSPDFLAKLGLNDHLSPTRRNGLHAMVQAIMTIAANMQERVQP